MNAVISGRAGLAILIEGENLASLHGGEGTDPVPRRQSEIRPLLGEMTDLRFLSDVDLRTIRRELETAIACENALSLLSLAVESQYSEQLRRRTLTALDSLLQSGEENASSEQVRAYLKNVMYARPLPSSAPASVASELARDQKAHAALELIAGIDRHQSAISDVRLAFDAIPDAFFEAAGGRLAVEELCVHRGLFHRLAVKSLETDNPEAWFDDPLVEGIRSSSEAEPIIRRWVEAYRSVQDLRGAKKKVPETGRHHIKHEGLVATTVSYLGELEPEILYAGTIMRDISLLIDLAAVDEAPVLISGEPGTAKEDVARAIHARSELSKSEFLFVDCAAYSVQSMLRPLKPLSGTLFFYNFHSASEVTQEVIADLVRKAVAGTSMRWMKTEISYRASIRCILDFVRHPITTENRRVRQLVDQWQPLHIPLLPLRARREEIPLLATRYLSAFNAHLGMYKPVRLSRDDIKILRLHSWPGNEDELRRVTLLIARYHGLRQANPQLANQLVHNAQHDDAAEARVSAVALGTLVVNDWDIPKAATELGLSDDLVSEFC